MSHALTGLQLVNRGVGYRRWLPVLFSSLQNHPLKICTSACSERHSICRTFPSAEARWSEAPYYDPAVPASVFDIKWSNVDSPNSQASCVCSRHRNSVSKVDGTCFYWVEAGCYRKKWRENGCGD